MLEVETQLATSVAQADAADAQHDATKVGSAGAAVLPAADRCVWGQHQALYDAGACPVASVRVAL